MVYGLRFMVYGLWFSGYGLMVIWYESTQIFSDFLRFSIRIFSDFCAQRTPSNTRSVSNSYAQRTPQRPITPANSIGPATFPSIPLLWRGGRRPGWSARDGRQAVADTSRTASAVRPTISATRSGSKPLASMLRTIWRFSSSRPCSMPI